ncbi:MAG: hypothetical protein ACOZBW_02670 [Thermodesulfobacteriota bacterium]
MKKKTCLVLLTVAIALACLGMGGMGGGIEVPKTAKNYSVALVDRSGLSISLSRFSCDGNTLFAGKLGMAEASVDFSRIRSVAFEKAENKMVTAAISLKDGDTVRLMMEDDIACYGAASVADVRIVLADIRSIEFKGTAQ